MISRCREILGHGAHMVVHLLPPTALLVAGMRTGTLLNWALWVGVLVQLALLSWQMGYWRAWLPPVGPVTLAAYALALAWIGVYLLPQTHDWILHVLQAALSLIPVALLSGYVLIRSGVLMQCRAQRLARRIVQRRVWPPLSECRHIPEVKALREALQVDAGPALALLDDPRPEVRLAALGALEYRRAWGYGQAERVVAVLRDDPTPEVRAAALQALANVSDRSLVERLAEALRDPEALVRRSAVECLFWNTEWRWSWIRLPVRWALADPAFRRDGSLLPAGHKLPDEAVDDFLAWTAEKGILGLRAAQTLAVHFASALQDDAEMAPELLEMLVHPEVAPVLRIELGRLLRDQGLLDVPTLESLLDPSQPTPLRLLAADALLEQSRHPGAIACLREIARIPNRDVALATADLVQRRLGLDLGLPENQTRLPPHSSKVMEILRNLMHWAQHPESSEHVLDDTFRHTSTPLGFQE
ncbi:MAG: hypothetical protein C4297_11205 [Gemmataceae bacterium]